MVQQINLQTKISTEFLEFLGEKMLFLESKELLEEEKVEEKRVHIKPQNESAADRKARLARCMQVLKQVDTGKPSAFVGMGGAGKPIDINWNAQEDEPEEDESWKNEEAVVEVQKKGKNIEQSFF